MTRIVTSSGSTHMGSGTPRISGITPTMVWVVILMSLSAGGWHRGGMTMFGGAGLAAAGPSHVPIVIGASSGIPLLGWVERVVYGSVMPLLQVAARVARLAADAALNRGGPA